MIPTYTPPDGEQIRLFATRAEATEAYRLQAVQNIKQATRILELMALVDTLNDALDHAYPDRRSRKGAVA